MQKILVLRLSAMGDVVLTVPVIRAFLIANKNTEIILVTRAFFAPFFYGIDRLTLVHPDLKNKHKGLFGLLTFAKELRKKHQFDAIVDLHDVLRTKIIRKVFSIKGLPTFYIDKGRKEKKEFIQKKNFTELKHTTERYKDVFIRAGFLDFQIIPKSIESSCEDQQYLLDFLADSFVTLNDNVIGIAPFAKHEAKMWGLDKIKELINLLLQEPNTKIFLFGGGDEEIEQLNLFEKKDQVFSVAGKFNLSEEIALISLMNKFFSMDSSNMHIASLCGVKTYSIWGGTHPFLGFKALGQDNENSIQISEQELSCRPCSVYGKLACSRKDLKYKCMKDISADTVYDRLK